jgi:hypothetical protein
MPARSADDVRIETYGGPRASLRALFELAEDSAAELDSYLDAGRVLVAASDDEIIGHLQLTGTGDPRQVEIKNLRFYQRQGFRMRSVERDAFTPATGYPPGLLIDGIELRDRVWLDREVLGVEWLHCASSLRRRPSIMPPRRHCR